MTGNEEKRVKMDAFSEEEKRLIAGRAQTFFERLADPDAVEHGNRDESDVEDVFEEWVSTFPSDSAFEHRLEYGGLTREECRKAISADTLADDEPLPEWVEQLDELAAAIQSCSPEEFTDAARPPENNSIELDSRSRRFGELSSAIASYAVDQVSDTPAREVLSEDAIDTMAQWLCVRFGTRFTRILYVELKTYVAAHNRDLARADPEEFDELPTDYYEDFIEYLFSDGFVDLCVEYPVFARLVVTQIRQWVDHLEEFCQRLKSDRELLTDRFNGGDAIGSVTDIEPLADDTHGDGRAVMRVEFTSGVTVAYKPRSVDAGVAFYRVVDRLNNHLSTPDFDTPTYLAKNGYGWMEWVEYDECPNEEAVQRYYQRAGSLVCIAYFLEFSDCQYENLVVAGEQPILVDAETVLHPFLSAEKQPVRSGVNALLDDNILLTALLPHELGNSNTESGASGMMSAISGFSVSSDETEIEEVTNPRIKAMNTDVMDVAHETARLDRSENIPSIDGVEQPPGEYLESVIDGFESTYETILKLRDEKRLDDEIGYPDIFKSIENRFVYRPTLKYANLIRALSSRECLSDGARFGVELEQLTVPFCDGRVDGSWPWSIYEAERKALKRLDPPRLTSQPDGTALEIHGERIGVKADESGLQRSQHRIDYASHEDMQMQVEFIRGCFGVSPTPEVHTSTVSVDRERVGSEQLRNEAIDLFDRVRSAAVRTDNGGYHWASIAPFSETDRLTLQQAGGSLYSGRTGIALLGAALYRVTGDEQYRTFTEKTVQPVRESVQLDQNIPALRTQGGALGIGSVAYGLGTVGRLLNEQEYIEDAAKVSGILDEEIIREDNQYDVIGGSAGTILGLLAVHDRTGAPELLSKAIQCGDYLLESRVETNGGYQAWKTLDDTPPLAGFGHGISGIAYALLKLADVTGQSKYRNAALDALKYEAEAFSKATDNWKDYREWTDSDMDQWCHGRSGIGLARLGMSEYTSDELVTQGVDRAIDGFQDDQLSLHDHLCCGNTGRAEFLLELDKRREQVPVAPQTLLGDVLERKREFGFYQTTSQTNTIPSPTFFHGISGIAYTLLRATEPKSLPCILLWE